MANRIVLRHGSLFSGIGGFDLAAEWCGWRNVFHCEINEFCNHLLNFYWPEAASIKNIVGYEWERWKGKIDVLTGGFPCQPYSSAGKQLGKADPRHLWPAMLTAIRAIRPGWVVGENVRGLVGWNGGMVFDEVQADLEAEGYDVLPFLLPAAGVNAPHRRERIWFIAHRISVGWNKERRKNNRALQDQTVRTKIFGWPQRPDDIWTSTNACGTGCHDRYDLWQERFYQISEGISGESQPEREKREPRSGQAHPFFTNPDCEGLEGQAGSGVQAGARRRNGYHSAEPSRFGGIPGWENFPQTQPAIRIGNDGLPDPLDFDTVFEGIPFPVKSISFSKWRTESIKAYGNAIVPQVALQIFRTIQRMMETRKKKI